MAQILESGTPINTATSAAISNVPGTLLGFYVNSTGGGTVVVGNGITSAATALSGTITPVIGFHRFPAYCTTGCYITIGGTINITAFFSAG